MRSRTPAQSPRNVVVSVFPERSHCSAVEGIVARYGPRWSHLPVSGDAAQRLLVSGNELLESIERNPSTPNRQSFSRAVLDAIPAANADDRYLVISPAVCPVDLVRDRRGNWGDRAIFSHYHTAKPSARRVEMLLSTHRAPLRTYLVVCPMAMDRGLARNLQDIMVVASALESRCPVEISLQPRYERAVASFSRNDISWLHVDTHGVPGGIMLGPSRDSRRTAEAEDLPDTIPVPLVILVGCRLTSGTTSIGSTLLRRGPVSIWGPCVTFTSLGLAGSDDSQITWYEQFLSSLVDGHDIGRSLLRARQALSDGSPLKFTWLILGSSLLSFSTTPMKPGRTSGNEKTRMTKNEKP